MRVKDIHDQIRFIGDLLTFEGVYNARGRCITVRSTEISDILFEPKRTFCGTIDVQIQVIKQSWANWIG